MTLPDKRTSLIKKSDTEFEDWLAHADRSELIEELRLIFYAKKTKRIDADNDFDAVSAWLSRYESRSAETFRAFKLEAERLMIWLAREKGYSPRNLSSVSNRDAANYIRFLLSEKSEYEFDADLLQIFDREKQPFDPSPLGLNSVSRARNALNRMFQGLRELRSPQGPYLDLNPWHHIRVKNYATKAHAGVSQKNPVAEILAPEERIISESQWHGCMLVIEQMPQDTPSQRAAYHRARWICALLYYSFMRRSEAANLLMGNFKEKRSGWWINIHQGKGGKARSVVANTHLMGELNRYRTFYGLPPYPLEDETIPAILPLKWSPGKKAESLSSQVIYNTIKAVFELAANAVGAQTQQGKKLSMVSPHWTRHTGITHALDKGADARMVQQQAGHDSLKTTAIYDHKERDGWAREMEKLGSIGPPESPK